MNDTQATISAIKEKINDFIRQRGWGAGHNALNLAVSINLEASELLEIFQWCSQEEADRTLRQKHKMTRSELEKAIEKLEKEMKEASKRLEFEYAAVLRDRIIELRGK